MKKPDLNLTVARESVSLRHRVVERLKDAILYGELEAGQKLVERELCDQLQISRPLLREALQQLQAEGLIVNVLHKGPSVAILSLDDIRHIYAVRRVLEQMAGEEFVRNASDEQREQLHESLELMHTSRVKRDLKAMLLEKNRFYDILAEGSGNPVVGQMITLLRNRVTLLRRFTLASPGRMLASLRELSAVVLAVDKGDAREAGRRCAAHIANAAAIAIAGYTSAVAVASSSSARKAPVPGKAKRQGRAARARRSGAAGEARL